MAVPLDMKDALLAPEFLDTFQVIRRKQTIDSNGRVHLINSLPMLVRGVVLPFTPDSLRREEDMQYQYKALEITTPFILRGPSTVENSPNTYAPDIVIWNNDQYLITALDDYSNYNPGYVKVIAVSMDYVDQAPLGISP